MSHKFVYGLLAEDKVCLLVDNTRFLIDPKLLTAKPDTMLGRMFLVHSSSAMGSEMVHTNERNEFEVGVSLFYCLSLFLSLFHSLSL